jgi:hypothetical protein
MKTKGIVVIIFIALAGFTAAAQEERPKVNITTDPPGAEVTLSGELSVTGVSPIGFAYDFPGRYILKIEKYGYETYSSRLYLGSGPSTDLMVSLKPKTRFKALARSFIIPGWGQVYTDQGLKGGLLLILAGGSAISFFVANDDYHTRVDKYNDLTEDYLVASTYDEKLRLYAELQRAREEAYDAETLRRITIGAVIATWTINILDLFLFFPDYGGSALSETLTIQPDFEEGGGQFTLTYRF